MVLPMCTHEADKQSLETFRTRTAFVGFQPDGSGGTLLLGLCRHCETTMAITIVKGEDLPDPQGSLFAPRAPADSDDERIRRE